MKKVGLILALLVAVAPLAAQKRDRIIERIVVKVNGEIFTQTDLEQLQIEALRKNNPALGNGNLDLQNDDKLKSALETVTPEILVNAVDELLLVQHGREQGYNLGDEQFKGVLDQVKKDNKLNDEQLKSALAQEGLTMESYRAMMERQMIVGTVQRQEIMQKATLTDEEARQYYDAHHKDFMKPATVTLREMLVTVPTEVRDGQDVFNVAADDAGKPEEGR
jgi:peptidyl-prolyl cis-trans isomerase SurA